MKRPTDIPLSEEQWTCVQNILEKFKETDRQVLSWYTGSGKTNIFLALAAVLSQKAQVKVGISAYLHSNIKDQTSARADLFLDSHGVIRALDHNYGDHGVYIFNPQTIFRRKLPFKFDYLIIDEAHVGCSPPNDQAYQEIIARHCVEGVKILGSSATPWGILHKGIFKDAYVHFRGMQHGLFEDRRLCDFSIHAERVDISLKNGDFTRSGEVNGKFIKTNLDLYKEASLAKVKDIAARYPREIGEKCLIVVPPGGNCDIAKYISTQLGESASYLIGDPNASRVSRKKESDTILEFKTNPKKKFLCVVYKCQIGFDMPELTSTIDLTMSRNVALIIQRWGRLARIDKKREEKKHYFYVFDNDLSPEMAEWILGTSVDYAMGRWDVPENGRALYKRKTPVFGVSGGSSTFSVDLSHMIRLHSLSGSNYKTITFSEEANTSGTWTIEKMVAEARKYKDRTEFSRNCRYVYRKMLRLHKKELNEVFPLKNKLKAWTLERAIEVAKKCRSRKQLRNNYPACRDFLNRNNLWGELAKILPPQTPEIEIWTEKKFRFAARGYKTVREFRAVFGSGYYWAIRNKKYDLLKECFPSSRGERSEYEQGRDGQVDSTRYARAAGKA